MQVWEQFKCVNFTHLNITASTLYLIAAPSTPKEARDEVLERSSNGENIGYTNAENLALYAPVFNCILRIQSCLSLLVP